MPPLRKKGVRKLLKTVGGKEHAGPQDHEEEAAPPPTAAATSSRQCRSLTENEINADPISSDEFDEEARPSQSPAKSPVPPPSLANKTSTNPRGSKRLNSKKEMSTTERSTPSRQAKTQKAKSMFVPRLGSFAKGQKNKRDIHETEDEGTANTQDDSSSSTSKRAWENEFGWGSKSSAAPKRQKTSAARTYGSLSKPGVSNIHASRPANGTSRAVYGKAFQRTLAAYSTANSNSSLDDSDSSSSTSEDDGDPESQFRKLRRNKDAKSGAKKTNPPSPPPEPRPNLLASLSLYKQPESSSPDSSNKTPATSQDPQALHNLVQEVDNFSDEETRLNASCPLCHEPVDPKHSTEYWKYHRKTITNQSLFCKEHRERTARIEYEARGLPKIMWHKLPGRIRKLQPRLEKVLRNEKGFESKYRTQNAGKLVSGQAAVYRPSKKKRLQELKDAEEVEDDAEFTLHNASPSTGYYGPRGRRLMMEILTTDLGNVFREVAVIDPVVGKSGFAEYLEHVLVPELTAMLVMEDLRVDEVKAEDVIEQSTALGAMLHEDVDDVVSMLSDEDGEEREMLDPDQDENYNELSE
ncbi:unnamed protein product [Periconia digitata]|uniref:Restriction of telomere capping protein 4 n=1 Tax=Periconia digitata TaxID=1303443 RepID=A0A9W4U4G6_9PLEO|nr:unnamed protein product [Periconia digitata]